MPWERYRRESVSLQLVDPFLSIYSDGTGRFNKTAREGWFDGADSVAVWVDRQQNRLAFDTADEDDVDAITISSGGEVATTRICRVAGVDIDALEETNRIPLRRDEETDRVIADLSDLPIIPSGAADDTDTQPEPGTETDANEEEREDEAETEGAFVCDEDGCDYDTDSERGLNIHKARVHESGADELSDVEQADGDLDLSRYGTSGASPTPEMVIQALAGNQSVHQVERDLGLGRRETEELLKRLGILNELQNGSPKIPRDRAERIVEEAVDG